MDRFASRKWLLMVLAACVGVGGHTGAPAVSGRSVATTPTSIDSLRSRLAILDHITDDELSDEYLAQARDFVARARRVWAERLRRCASDSCRHAIITDQLERHDYSYGRNSAQVSGLPWPTGLFDLTKNRSGGYLGLYPIGGDELLVIVRTVEDQGRWMCNMIAKGRVVGGRAIEMRSLDEGRLRYRFQPEGNGRWSFEQLGEYRNYHCGFYGDITGSYAVELRRWRLGEAVGFDELGSSASVAATVAT